MELTLWLEFVTFVVLMGLSGFFSSSETAMFSLNQLHLEQLRREGSTSAALIQRMLNEPRRLIITILIGNEFVNVSASVISAAVVIELLGSELKWVNLFIMIPVLLLVGEITPKTLAIRNNVAFAKFQCRPISLFATLIAPLRWAVRLVADWVTTRIVGPQRSRGNIITEDLVRTLAHEAVGTGALDQTEAQFIDQIFDLGSKTVEDIMTPRSQVYFLQVELGLNEAIADLRRTWQTRVPVYEGHRDRVVGILHARDLLGMDAALAGEDPAGLRRLLREAYFVPESKLAVDLFETFRERRLSVAIVVDEYGGVTGLVTMNDILHCIFGEPGAEAEAEAGAGRKARIEELDGGRISVDGAMRVADFNKDTGANLPTDVAETIGGLVLHLHGELPDPGVEVEIADLTFRVAEMRENRVRRVELARPLAPALESISDVETRSESAPTEQSAGDPGSQDDRR